jgi:hypothetical protein
MSLNRAVAALGAVAVVGAATVGLSAAYANSNGKPEPRIYVTSGSTWTPVTPTCYNGGKVMSVAKLNDCVKKVQKLGSTNTAKHVTVHSNTSFTISVDKDVTDIGWDASAGATQLVPATTKFQANNIPVSGVLATSTDQTTGATTTADKGTILVVERKGTSNDIYGVWLATLQSASTS